MTVRGRSHAALSDCVPGELPGFDPWVWLTNEARWSSLDELHRNRSECRYENFIGSRYTSSIAAAPPTSVKRGSGNLIQILLRHNLVDQYRLWVFPLVIGSGKRLFSEGTIPSGLKLVDSKVSTTGVAIATYEPAGEIITGSFALE